MDNRKRVNSCLTYDEYVEIYDKPPRKPSIRPKEKHLDIPDLSLENECGMELETASPLGTNCLRISDRIELSYKPKNVIEEEVDENQQNHTTQIWMSQNNCSEAQDIDLTQVFGKKEKVYFQIFISLIVGQTQDSK